MKIARSGSHDCDGGDGCEAGGLGRVDIEDRSFSFARGWRGGMVEDWECSLP